LRRRNPALRPPRGARRGARREDEQARARHRQAARGLAGGRLRSRQVPRHPPRRGAAAHRAQGPRRGDRRRACGRGGPRAGARSDERAEGEPRRGARPGRRRGRRRSAQRRGLQAQTARQETRREETRRQETSRQENQGPRRGQGLVASRAGGSRAGRARGTQARGAGERQAKRSAATKKGKGSRQAAGLQSYRSKRDFGRTREPRGRGSAEASRAPRFVIQEHSARRLHWDLRLERDGVLVCWALPKGLPEAPKENRFAAATEKHTLEYLDFHGEIPAGSYGAGTMTIWDRGTYECLKWEPRKVEVALHGERVDGRYALFPIASGEAPKDWMIHRMDPPEDPQREPMPERLTPMLACPGRLPSDD